MQIHKTIPLLTGSFVVSWMFLTTSSLTAQLTEQPARNAAEPTAPALRSTRPIDNPNSNVLGASNAAQGQPLNLGVNDAGLSTEPVATGSQPALGGPPQTGVPTLVDDTLLPSSDALNEVNSRQQASKERDLELEGFFEGELFFEALSDQEDVPTRISILVRRSREVAKFAPHGSTPPAATTSQVYYERQTVNPMARDLSPEQRLGVFTALIETQLRKVQQGMTNGMDTGAMKKSLQELRDLYSRRFGLETDYQDYKVRKIERRAQKLRGEVDARKSATKDWVDAMVTLDKMRASGIGVLPGTVSAGVGLPATTVPDAIVPGAIVPGTAFPGAVLPSPKTINGNLGLPPVSPGAPGTFSLPTPAPPSTKPQESRNLPPPITSY
ncbi:MAG: hypothetical protein MI861_25705 [Pirellulales bacterium]|nr:hypothetical protein [Pirellulales bacterium]